jgi:hypothetical protein|tara:strand:+ start:66 stop:317 length:252 start_codon:yes stop_codon:yes gene_type:complete
VQVAAEAPSHLTAKKGTPPGKKNCNLHPEPPQPQVQHTRGPQIGKQVWAQTWFQFWDLHLKKFEAAQGKTWKKNIKMDAHSQV